MERAIKKSGHALNKIKQNKKLRSEDRKKPLRKREIFNYGKLLFFIIALGAAAALIYIGVTYAIFTWIADIKNQLQASWRSAAFYEKPMLIILVLGVIGLITELIKKKTMTMRN